MQNVRLLMKRNLPIVLASLCLFLVLFNIAGYVIYIRDRSQYGIIYTIMSNIVLIGLGLYVLIKRHSRTVRIQEISYFFLFAFAIHHFRDIVLLGYLALKHGTLALFEQEWIIFSLVPIVLFVLVYEKGYLRRVFQKDSYQMDRMFYLYLFFSILASNIPNFVYRFQSVRYGLFIMKIDRPLVLIVVFGIGLIINLINEPSYRINHRFNTMYVLGILALLIYYDVVRYFDYIGDGRFELINLLFRINLYSYLGVIVLYTFYKITSWNNYTDSF